MCGRFTLSVDPAQLRQHFEGISFPEQYAARYNIAPSQPILAVPNDGRDSAGFFLWGLIPSWARDASMGSRMINARGETLAEKPAYRGAYKYKRCLIPADGFYEWQARAGTRARSLYFIHLKDGAPFAFAGLWDEWQAPDGSSLRTCTIITTAPNPLVAPIHDRMPVLLQPADYDEWLDPAPRAPASLQRLIAPFAPEPMEAYPVSALVNSPSNEGAECVQPA